MCVCVAWCWCSPHTMPLTCALPLQAAVAVQFVINYEEGGEHCLLNGDTKSEWLLRYRMTQCRPCQTHYTATKTQLTLVVLFANTQQRHHWCRSH